MALIKQPKTVCSFHSTATPWQTWLVSEWHGEEGMSRPYCFDILLARAIVDAQADDLDEEVMLGKPATLELIDGSGQPHPYHGVITKVQQQESSKHYSRLSVVLEPRMALLRQSRFSEIWLDKTLPELIRAVLKESSLQREGPAAACTNNDEGYVSERHNDSFAGNDGDSYDFAIRLSQNERLFQQPISFICQFEESSFAFLSRLLEYYGAYYFFEQQREQEALIICADLRNQPQSDNGHEMCVFYRPMDTELEIEKELAVVRTFNRSVVSQSQQVILQDFSASHAQLQLHAAASIASASLAKDAPAESLAAANTSSGFQGVYGLYGQHFDCNQDGQWLAMRRAESLGCRYREFNGMGRACGLRAGYPLRLQGHPRQSFNACYQVIEIKHQGFQPLLGLDTGPPSADRDITTHFTAIAADVQFRAPLVTPRPCVQGLLSAVIDGDDDSKTPLLNKHGCYKVSFPFVRCTKEGGKKNQTRSSAWIRMATLSSGASHGMHFPLLKGTEVLISFLGGDPDRPVIVGSVPNSENPNRVSAANATQSGLSTPGGHYITMEDNQSGPMMTMGAPGGNTKFTLGSGNITGAHLRTDADMRLASSSLTHEIPGVYSLKIGGGSMPLSNAVQQNQPAPANADKELENPTDQSDKPQAATQTCGEKQITQYWTGYNRSWSPLAGIIAKCSNNTFTNEANLAGNQNALSVGVCKLNMTIQGSFNQVNIAGPSCGLSLNKWQYAYENFKKQVGPAQEDNILQKIENMETSLLKAVFMKVMSKIYNLDVANMITLTVGSSSISLYNGGAAITCGKGQPIILQGNVNIKGNLTISGEVNSNGPMFSDDGLHTSGEVSGDTVSCQQLRAVGTELATTVSATQPRSNLRQIEENIQKFETVKEQVNVAAQGYETSLETLNNSFKFVQPQN